MVAEIPLVIVFAYKMLPSILSLFLCWGGFTFTQVARGIEGENDTCSDFDDVKAAKFPCIKAGVTALSVVLAGFNLGISLITISHLSGISGIAQVGTLFGVCVIFVCFAYIVKYDSEAFKLHKSLQNSNWRVIKFFGKNPALSVNVFCLIGLSLYQIHIMSILVPVVNGL